MSISFPDVQLDPNISRNVNTGMTAALNTMQGLNNARAQYLKNQASESQLPYVGPQAQAQTQLAQQQAKYYPTSLVSGILGNLGKIGYNVRPGAAYIGLPKPVADQLASNNISGQSNLGALRNPNLGTADLVSGLLSNIMPGLQQQTAQQQPSQQSTAGNIEQPGQQSTGSFTTPQPSINQPLQLSPEQINALSSRFGNNLTQQGLSQAVANPAQGQAQQDQIQQVQSQLRAAAQNAAAPASLLQKYNYAQNIAKTLKTNEDNFGNPALSFANYMGTAGAAKLAKDKVAASLGNASPLYENYRAYEDSVPILAHQLTQFFGSSVQPHVTAQLEQLQNPVTWDKTPGVAIRIYNNLKDIIQTEGNTAAQSVGRQNEFNQTFPAFNAASFYQKLSSMPKYAKDVISALPSSQQQALKSYHLSLKGSANANAP